eukprot:3969058-Amphidinium_carterae.2
MFGGTAFVRGRLQKKTITNLTQQMPRTTKKTTNKNCNVLEVLFGLYSFLPGLLPGVYGVEGSFGCMA